MRKRKAISRTPLFTGVHRPASRGNASTQNSPAEASSSRSNSKWESVRCPICLESPHNAVLLICESHSKGCRPLLCDTSYRHSNCLDQFRNSGKDASDSLPIPISLGITSQSEVSDNSCGDSQGKPSESLPLQKRRSGKSVAYADSDAELEDVSDQNLIKAEFHLSCPLCRSKVLGWKALEFARSHLNSFSRDCSHEGCPFSGNYEALRKHARSVHPLARPTRVDPARAREWRRLERQRDLGDALSTIRSAMPRARIFGDYVIGGDDSDEDYSAAGFREIGFGSGIPSAGSTQNEEEDNGDMDFPGDEGNWWTVLVLFHTFGPRGVTAPVGRSSRSMPRLPPPRRGLPFPSIPPPFLRLPVVSSAGSPAPGDLPRTDESRSQRLWGSLQADADSVENGESINLTRDWDTSQESDHGNDGPPVPMRRNTRFRYNPPES